MEEFCNEYCTGSVVIFDDSLCIVKNMKYGKGKCTCCNKILITSYNIMMHKMEERLYRMSDKDKIPLTAVHDELKLYEILCVDGNNITLFDDGAQSVVEIAAENCVDIDLGLEKHFYWCTESGKIRKMVSNGAVDIEEVKLMAYVFEVGFVACIVKICLF